MSRRGAEFAERIESWPLFSAIPAPLREYCPKFLLRRGLIAGGAGGANWMTGWPWSFQTRRTLSRPPARIVLPSALAAAEYM